MAVGRLPAAFVCAAHADNCETPGVCHLKLIGKLLSRPQSLGFCCPRRMRDECVRARRKYVSKRHSPSDADSEGQQSAPVRVLIVDDHEPWRRWVYSELASQQQLHVVGEASDGLEAVRKAEELKPDIILLDIGLPSLNGLDAAKRMTHSTPDSKIIFLTGQNDSDLAKEALSNGAIGYLLKAYAGNELLPAIAAAVQGRRFVSRALATGF